ncbi:hypothetical protein F511_43891 [Dorcoceras hygrometricum]|uniref:Uncharacterized protein n=1 Tax=Dorcoceras hygrometricum TaxID=472368 RepID=A0A2Z7D8Z4_9LAMI|nr:hypothetical protein F511_43891 [Dorcoceras hygrometricum]
MVEKAAQAAEEQSLRSELDAVLDKKTTVETTVTLRKSTRLPSFDFKKALADMDDEGEAEEEEEGEEEEGDATPSSSPRP